MPASCCTTACAAVPVVASPLFVVGKDPGAGSRNFLAGGVVYQEYHEKQIHKLQQFLLSSCSARANISFKAVVCYSHAHTATLNIGPCT